MPVNELSQKKTKTARMDSGVEQESTEKKLSTSNITRLSSTYAMLDEHFELSFHLDGNNNEYHVKTADQIFNLILSEWMYGFETKYTKNQYNNLYSQILQLVCDEKKIKLLLPGFPVKSPNTKDKVLSCHADYAEFLAIRNLTDTARKIKAIYPKGIEINIMSDYHTFDQHIGVPERIYDIYHQDIKEMVNNAGADDIINIINLWTFPEFQNIPRNEVSEKLFRDYGDKDFVSNFDDIIKKDSNMLARYKQLLKFMTKDQVKRLPGSPRSKQSRKVLKSIVVGMITQGIALDKYLKQQTFLTGYIRLSIHHHKPSSNKFSVDLFKKYVTKDGVLRSPWHHVVVFDTLQGDFIIDHKDSILASADKKTLVFTVKYNDIDWLLIKVHFTDEKERLGWDNDSIDASFVRNGFGIILTNKSTGNTLASDIVHPTSLTNMVKEFAFVVLRGFSSCEHREKNDIKIYSCHGVSTNGAQLNGPIHEVKSLPEVHGLVNEKSESPVGLEFPSPPAHIDFSCGNECSHREHMQQQKEADNYACASSLTDNYDNSFLLKTALKSRWRNTFCVPERTLSLEQIKRPHCCGKGTAAEQWSQNWADNGHEISKKLLSDSTNNDRNTFPENGIGLGVRRNTFNGLFAIPRE